MPSATVATHTGPADEPEQHPADAVNMRPCTITGPTP